MHKLPTRVTRGECPVHGAYRIIETYDAELAQWRVISETFYPLHERAKARIHPKPRDDGVHSVPLAADEAPSDPSEAV